MLNCLYYTVLLLMPLLAMAKKVTRSLRSHSSIYFPTNPSTSPHLRRSRGELWFMTFSSQKQLSCLFKMISKSPALLQSELFAKAESSEP